MTNYPSSNNILLDDESVIPALLKMFLDCLINDKLTSQPFTVYCSGLETEDLLIIHTVFSWSHLGSSELLRLGFCISYDELTRFKQSVMHNSCAVPIHGSNAEPTFVQFVADNVYHNVRTLDEMGTLFAMGIILACVFPVRQFANVSRKISHSQKQLKTSEIFKEDTMSIVTYSKNPGYALVTLTLVDYAFMLKPIALLAAVNII
jgi:uncharacterized membrane protein YciS (DUF1049 family)